tara:strand:+ start:1072 stop:1263 length:192 start_codon:yes stop_codon:yes gene_type:complete
MTDNKNEVTITINVSDSLLNTFANLLILANVPAPQVLGLPPGMAVAKPPQNKAPIGFKAQVKK